MNTLELAAFLGTENGLAAVRALQGLGVLGHGTDATDDRSDDRSVDQTGPRAILDWQPRGSGDDLRFERGQFFRCKPKVIGPKKEGTLRVCLFGESMAAGFPLSPAYSPAIALQDMVQGAVGSRAVEVIDLAMANMGPSEQLRVAEAARQIAPDVFVFMGGNNWHYGLSVEPTASPAARVQYAQAVRAGGAARLASTFRDELTNRARVMLQVLVAAARAVQATPVVVIPPVNHAWQRRTPPPWLGQQRTARWFEALAVGEQALAVGDAEGALSASSTMKRLEGEGALTGVPEGLAKKAHLAAGRLSEARDAAMAAVCAANWHNVAWALPQVPSFVADVLRAESAALGCACIDLEAVFAEHTGSPFLDFRMFFDQCHLSVEGLQVAMAEVAATIIATVTDVPDVTDVTGPGTEQGERRQALLDGAPRPTSTTVGSAWFQAAHWMSQFAPVPDPAVLEAGLVTCLQRAVDADDHFRTVMLDALGLKNAAIAPSLQAAFPAAVRVPGLGGVLSSSRLNGSWVNAVLATCRAHHVDGTDRVVDDVIASHDRALRRGVDLSHPAHADWFWERTPLAAHDPNERQGTPYYRGAWPESAFSFVCAGDDDVAVDLVARAPSGGTVEIFINDVAVGSLPLGAPSTTWQRWRGTLPARNLVRGVNRVRLRWPSLDVDDDVAIADAVRLLALGVDPDLFPVFGEVYSFRAQTLGAA